MSLLILPGNLLLARFCLAASDLLLAVKLPMMDHHPTLIGFQAQHAWYHFFPTRNLMISYKFASRHHCPAIIASDRLLLAGCLMLLALLSQDRRLAVGAGHGYIFTNISV